NHLPGQPGYAFPSCYGREYYFDYGYPTPELRIIVISPTVQNITGHMITFGTDVWLYQKNDPHYNWVNATIQAARAAAIPQTMVVSFDQCLGTTVEECGQSYHHQSPYDSSGTKFEADLFPEYSSACFANPQDPGQPYTPWPSLAGQGVPLIVSAAFGAGLYATLNPGEILVKDSNGNGVYDYGEPFIGGFEPAPGAVLTGGQASNSHIGFIDTNGNGQWDPGETLFKDADSNDGCST